MLFCPEAQRRQDDVQSIVSAGLGTLCRNRQSAATCRSVCFQILTAGLVQNNVFKKVFTIFKNQKNPQNSSKRPSRLLRNLEEFPRICQEALKPQQNPPNHFNPLQNPLNLTHLYEFNNETLQTSETSRSFSVVFVTCQRSEEATGATRVMPGAAEGSLEVRG